MALDMIYENEVLGRSVSVASRRTDIALLVREARQERAAILGDFLGNVVYTAASLLGKSLKKLAYAVEAWRQRRATYGELSALDDRLLADIGIQRSDISAIADASVGQRVVGGRVTAAGSLTNAA